MIVLLALAIAVVLAAAAPAGARWPNRRAPDFSLTTLEGQRVSLSEMRGRVVFVDFWASWCPPCKKEFPELVRLTSEYDPSRFVTMAVSEDKMRSNVERFVSAYPDLPENFHVLLDSRSDAVKKYSVLAMPTSFIIDAGGVVRYVHYGFNESDPDSWRTELKTLLK